MPASSHDSFSPSLPTTLGPLKERGNNLGITLKKRNDEELLLLIVKDNHCHHPWTKHYSHEVGSYGSALLLGHTPICWEVRLLLSHTGYSDCWAQLCIPVSRGWGWKGGGAARSSGLVLCSPCLPRCFTSSWDPSVPCMKCASFPWWMFMFHPVISLLMPCLLVT